MQRYYFKVDDKQNIDFTEKGSCWFFVGGFGYAYDPYYGDGRFKTVAHTEQPMVYFDQGRYGIRTNKDTLTAPLYDELSWFENGVTRLAGKSFPLYTIKLPTRDGVNLLSS